MTKFKKVSHVDKKLADGIEVRAELGDVYGGTFTIRYVNRYLQSVEAELTKIKKLRARELGVRELSDSENIITLLCDYALIGWADVLDEDEKPVEFSPEVAREFFSDEENNWIMYLLMEAAVKPDTFQSVAEKN